MSFTERTLYEIINWVRDSVFSEIYADKKGFLQSLNPRIKFIAFLCLLVSVVCVRSLQVILFFLLFSLLLVYFSKIPFKFYLTRVLIFIPIFTGIVAFPSIFNIFQQNKGRPLIVLYNFGYTVNFPFLKPFSTIEITEEGVYWALTFVLRVTVSVSLTVLLILTTKWPSLLSSLSSIRTPETFIFILHMTYRYIFLLATLVSNMLFSRKSRIVGKETAIKSWKLNANIIGALFLKSHDMSENIYLAMLSRGFNGQVSRSMINVKERQMKEGNIKSYLFLIATVIFCAIILLKEALM